MEFATILNALSSYGPIAVPTTIAIFLAWHIIRRAEKKEDDRLEIVQQSLKLKDMEIKELKAENRRLQDKIEALLDRFFSMNKSDK